MSTPEDRSASTAGPASEAMPIDPDTGRRFQSPNDSGTERRSRIDSETVQGLQLINGGMAAGLVAMLPHVFETSYSALANWMVGGVAFGALGLVAAIVHSRLRRKCSLEYSKNEDDQQPQVEHPLLRRLQTVPAEPRVCTCSIIAMWTSLVMFILGAALVCVGFLAVEPQAVSSDVPCWSLEHANSGLVRFNRCTGEAEHLDAP